MLGGRYGRVLFLKEYASYIKDDILSELCSLERSGGSHAGHYPRPHR